MKVRLFAFEWILGNGIDFSTFATHLQNVGPAGYSFNGMPRHIYLEHMEGNYYAGLILSVRDSSRLLMFRQQGTSAKLRARDFQGTDRLAECNFFVINSSTCRGLYAHYHQSLGLSALQIVLRKHYETLKQNLINQDATAYSNTHGTISKSRLKKITRAYKGLISVEMKLHGDGFHSLIEDLEQITRFEFYYEQLLPNTSPFRHIRDQAKREKISVTFQPVVSPRQRRRAINRTVREAQISDGRVYGTDQYDNTKSIPIKKNPDVFDEWEFDDFIRNLDLDLHNPTLTDAGPINNIVAVLEQESDYFGGM